MGAAPPVQEALLEVGQDAVLVAEDDVAGALGGPPRGLQFVFEGHLGALPSIVESFGLYEYGPELGPGQCNAYPRTMTTPPPGRSA